MAILQKPLREISPVGWVSLLASVSGMVLALCNEVSLGCILILFALALIGNRAKRST
jgi:hypothetical protein